MEYKHRYTDYMTNKRDNYYVNLLRKITEKLDFERYQCTSPNIERVRAEWKGQFKVLEEAHAELEKFLYLFLCEKAYDLKQPYERLADQFTDGFRIYIQQKK